MPNSNRAGGAHHSTHGGEKSGNVNASQSNMSNMSGIGHAQMGHHDGQGKGGNVQELRSSYNTKESMLSSSGNFPLGMQFGSNNFSASGKFASMHQVVYQPDGLAKAQEVKKQFDTVLDDIKGIVQHVTQREEMKTPD